MRKKLKSLSGKRLKFIGIFDRYGTKKNWHGFPETTILLKNIHLSGTNKGETITDHLWFSMTKGFQKLGELKSGDLIGFEARVAPYVKGYVNYRDGIDERETDLRLSRPTKFSKMAMSNQLEPTVASSFSVKNC